MTLVNFMLVILLCYITWLATYSAQRMQPRSGPNYYLDMGTASANSIQPEYRVTREEARKRKHALEVECFNDGTPYRITKLYYGRRLMGSRYFFVDGYGRLGYVGQEEGWGYVRMTRVAPPRPD